MARFDRLTVLHTIIDIGLVPLFHQRRRPALSRMSLAHWLQVARASWEFTNRGDQALEVFKGTRSPLCQSSTPADPRRRLRR